MPAFGVSPMKIEMSDFTAGGRRRGSGRKPRNFKSQTEIRRELKTRYGVTGLSRLSTNQLREMATRTSGDDNIIYKS